MGGFSGIVSVLVSEPEPMTDGHLPCNSLYHSYLCTSCSLSFIFLVHYTYYVHSIQYKTCMFDYQLNVPHCLTIHIVYVPSHHHGTAKNFCFPTYESKTGTLFVFDVKML
jgi:hypothetical protein